MQVSRNLIFIPKLKSQTGGRNEQEGRKVEGRNEQEETKRRNELSIFRSSKHCPYLMGLQSTA